MMHGQKNIKLAERSNLWNYRYIFLMDELARR